MAEARELDEAPSVSLVKSSVSLVKSSVCVFAACVILTAGCEDDPPTTNADKQAPPKAAVELRIAVVGAPHVIEGLNLVRGEWAERTGGSIAATGIELSALAAAESIDADVAIYPSRYLGELAARGLLRPVRKSVLESEELALKDVFRLVRDREMAFNGETYGLPLGTSTLLVCYDGEKLPDATAGSTTTWNDFATMGDASVDDQSQSTAQHIDPKLLANMLLAQAAAYTPPNARPTFCFDPADMQPRVNSPAFVRALENLASLASVQSVLAGKGDAAFGRPPGRALNAKTNQGIGYQPHSTFLLPSGEKVAGRLKSRGRMRGEAEDDRQNRPPSPQPSPASGRGSDLDSASDSGNSPADSGDSKPAQKSVEISSIVWSADIRWSALPAAAQHYDDNSQTWRDAVGTPQPVTFLDGEGLLVSVTSSTRNAVSAFQLSQWLASSRVSRLLARGGAGPLFCRRSQTSSAADWFHADMPTAQITEASAAIEASMNRSAAGEFPRILGVDDYLAALGEAATAYLSGELSAEDALQAAAAGWDGITDQRGREEQLEIYRQYLGISADR